MGKEIGYYDEEQDILYVSKTELKNDMKALQALAREIINLSKAQRAKIPLDDTMLEALTLADKIKNKPDALRRHVQFMAKHLDDIDLADINKGLDFIRNKHQIENLQFQQYEKLRDDVLAMDNQGLEQLLSENPSLERQKLRQLIRTAKKEQTAEKPDKGYKSLFAYLKESVSL